MKSALSTAASSTVVAGGRHGHGRGVVAALLDRICVCISAWDDRAAAVYLGDIVVATWGDRAAVVRIPSLAGRASKATLFGNTAMDTLGGATIGGVAALESRRMAVATLAGGSGGRVNGAPNV